MNVRAKFLGAAGTVTGSKHLLEIGHKKVLVDCGLFQGIKSNRLKNWDPFPIDVTSIDAVVLTHAHLDHTGYLPRLVKQGYSGPIYCSKATLDLAMIILKDAAKLQEEEANYARKKGYSRHANPEPLFSSEDAESAISLMVSQAMDSEFFVTDNTSCVFQEAGHILGATSVQLIIQGDHQRKTVTFSGDLGRYNDPILYDPVPFPSTDILFMESTYGDRVNPATDIEGQLENIINETMGAGGCLLIPAFAVGRTQLMIYYMNRLLAAKRIPNVKIFVDSPMAISVTSLYRKYAHIHKLKDDDLTDDVHPIFDFANLKYCRSHDESYKLNLIQNNAIIISASGMMTGGRILHHLYNRLGNKNDTILLAGYQAVGTRGRRIQDGEEKIKLFGVEIDVKCRVAHIDGLSAHGDQTEMMKWLDGIKQKPKMTFFIHGEDKSAKAFSRKVSDELGWNCYVPFYLESFSIFEGI